MPQGKGVWVVSSQDTSLVPGPEAKSSLEITNPTLSLSQA